MSKKKEQIINLKREAFNDKLREVFKEINKRDKRLLGWNPNPEAYVHFSYADDNGTFVKINVIE